LIFIFEIYDSIETERLTFFDGFKTTQYLIYARLPT